MKPIRNNNNNVIIIIIIDNNGVVVSNYCHQSVHAVVRRLQAGRRPLHHVDLDLP